MLRLRATPPEVHDELALSGTVQRLLDGDALDHSLYGSSLLAMIVQEARALGATTFELDVEGAGEIHDRMAADSGLTLRRELLRMGRSLPTGLDWALDVRPFRVGEDEEAWLA